MRLLFGEDILNTFISITLAKGTWVELDFVRMIIEIPERIRNTWVLADVLKGFVSFHAKEVSKVI